MKNVEAGQSIYQATARWSYQLGWSHCLLKVPVKAEQWVSTFQHVEQYYTSGSVTHTTVAKLKGELVASLCKMGGNSLFNWKYMAQCCGPSVAFCKYSIITTLQYGCFRNYFFFFFLKFRLSIITLKYSYTVHGSLSHTHTGLAEVINNRTRIISGTLHHRKWGCHSTDRTKITRFSVPR